MADPYLYPGTKVLRNKLDIRNQEELQAFERMQSARAVSPGIDSGWGFLTG